MSEPLSAEGYAATGGMCCPACGATTLFPGGFTRRGMIAVTQPGVCLHCPATWTAVYELVGYEALHARQQTPCRS